MKFVSIQRKCASSCFRLAIDNGHAVDEGGEYSLDDVVSAIKNGSTFVMVFQNPANGDWTRGDRVFLARVNDIERPVKVQARPTISG
ncbi:hypothetical protein [Paraburkholderia terrae]